MDVDYTAGEDKEQYVLLNNLRDDPSVEDVKAFLRFVARGELDGSVSLDKEVTDYPDAFTDISEELVTAVEALPVVYDGEAPQVASMMAKLVRNLAKNKVESEPSVEWETIERCVWELGRPWATPADMALFSEIRCVETLTVMADSGHSPKPLVASSVAKAYQRKLIRETPDKNLIEMRAAFVRAYERESDMWVASVKELRAAAYGRSYHAGVAQSNLSELCDEGELSEQKTVSRPRLIEYTLYRLVSAVTDG